MVSERDFIAPALLGKFVEIPAPHTGAKVTGRAPLLNVDHSENIALENTDGHTQKLCVAFDECAVSRRVSGIHYDKFQPEFELPVTAKLLHAFREQKGIFSARNTNGNFIALANKLVFFDAFNEVAPNFFAEFFDERTLDFLHAHERSLSFWTSVFK